MNSYPKLRIEDKEQNEKKNKKNRKNRQVAQTMDKQKSQIEETKYNMKDPYDRAEATDVEVMKLEEQGYKIVP